MLLKILALVVIHLMHGIVLTLGQGHNRALKGAPTNDGR